MNRKITPVNQHINSAWSRTTALYARTATMLGIGYPELMVLYALVIEGDMTQRQIAENYGLLKQTVNTVVRSLYTRAYIQMTSGTVDRRKKVISLTESGQAYAENLLEPLLDAEDKAYHLIGEERSQGMADTLDLYNIIVERELTPPIHA